MGVRFTRVPIHSNSTPCSHPSHPSHPFATLLRTPPRVTSWDRFDHEQPFNFTEPVSALTTTMPREKVEVTAQSPLSQTWSAGELPTAEPGGGAEAEGGTDGRMVIAEIPPYRGPRTADGAGNDEDGMEAGVYGDR